MCSLKRICLIELIEHIELLLVWINGNSEYVYGEKRKKNKSGTNSWQDEWSNNRGNKVVADGFQLCQQRNRSDENS